MPASVITAATTLRVLIGVVGAGLSLYSNRTEQGNFDFGKIPEAIFGETVGSFFADWLKEGTTAAYNALVGKLQLTADDPLIYELQIAVRKAELTATLIACHSCIDRLRSEQTAPLEILKGKVVKGEELAWLSAVASDLEEQLNDSPNLFAAKADYTELLTVFDRGKMRSEDAAIEEFKIRSKESVLRDIRNSYYSTFGGQKSIAYSDNGYKLLEDALLNGWVNFKRPNASIVKLGIVDGGLAEAEPRQDWFELVGLIFNGDFKTNQRIQTVLLRKDTEITKTTLLKFASEGLESFGRLERDLAELASTVTELRKESQVQSGLTNEKLDDVKGMVETLLTRFLSERGISENIGFSPARQSVLEDFTPPLMVGMVYRTALVVRLTDSLLNSNFLALYGSSGMGKSVLSYQISINTGLAWQRIEMRGLTPSEINHRLLNARKAVEAAPSANILVDDLNFDKEVHVYDKALGDFLNAARRTSSKIIISSQHTLPVELASLYASETDTLVNVPALDIQEIKELASIHGCPQGSRLSQWSNIVWAQTKGHPLLAHARILNIARKGWAAPSADELFGSLSLEEARQKVRQKLEETLGADERTLVYRLSVFTDKFRRENALEMAQHLPSMHLGGEIFDRLVGPWVEPLDSQYFRLSPLLEGNATKVFGAEETKALHRTAADSIIKPRTISHVEFNALLMHGLLGDYPKAFFAAMMGWLGVDDEHKKPIADYVEWFKFVARDKPLISDRFGNQFARMLQYEIAACVDAAAAAEVALRWEAELHEMSSVQPSDYPEFLLRSFEARFLQTVLFTDSTRFSFEKIAVWSAKMLAILPNLSRSFRDIPQEIRDEQNAGDLPEIFESIQNPAFLLGNIIVKCNRADDTVGFLSALDATSSAEVETVWQLLREQPNVVVMLVDNIWLNDATSDSPKWQERLEQLDEVIEMAIRRKVDALVANAYVAKAIIYQEYLATTESALEQLDTATKRLGYEHDETANYRAKRFLLEKQYAEGVAIWRVLLPKLVKEKHYGRLFFSRDAQVAAGFLNQWDDVAEFALLGAEMALNAHWGFPATTIEDLISVSFHGDAALAFWKNGEIERALSEMEGILERLHQTPVKEDDKARLLYMRLQYCLTWMSSKARGTAYPEPPAGFFTNPNKFEEVIRDAKVVPYTMLWYMMAECEFRFRTGAKYLRRLQTELKAEPNPIFDFAAHIIALKHSVVNLDFDLLVPAYDSMILKFGEQKDDRQAIMSDLKRVLIAAILLAFSSESLSIVPFGKWKKDLLENGYDELKAWLEQFEASLMRTPYELVTVLVNEHAPSDERIIASVILTFTDALAPRERFYANSVFTTSLNLGNWQDIIDPLVGERLSLDWKRVALYQRFALRSPSSTVPFILAAVEDERRNGFAKAAFVLLASSRAIDLELGETALRTLRELAAKIE